MIDTLPPPMRRIRDLHATEIRILGALFEKEQATPEYYPLTVNALLAACNQKSNRDPATELTETEVVEALDALRRDALTWRSEGARTERWSQSISRRLELDPAEKAVLTLLMLRGPQTVGELRSRSGRLHAFADLAEAEGALERLAASDRELARELARRPGQKESRWTHLLAGDLAVELEVTVAPEPAARSATDPTRRVEGRLAERVERLEERVRQLEEQVAAASREG
jgi:uncharacterized protein